MGLAENVSALATRVATEIKAVRTEMTAAIAASDAADAADNRGDWNPGDHNLDVWTYDPLLAASSIIPPANGALLVSAVKVDSPVAVNTVAYAVATAGATLTASRNYIGLYNEAGTLLASTADQATAWATTGQKATALTSSVNLVKGIYYVGLITTATTRPGFVCIATNTTVLHIGRTNNAQLRAYTSSNSYTALPATRPTATTLTGTMIWFGLA